MGRPPLKITDQMISQVQTLAGYGLTNSQIATIIDIAETTLKSKPEFTAAIKKGRELAAGNLHRTAYEMAVKDKNPAMVMFMLKCKHGWREKQEIDITHGFRPVVIRKRDGSTVELSLTKDRKEIDDGKGEEEAD